jgi:hypothetical protein
VGKNLCAMLQTIRDGRNKTRNLTIGEIFEYDIDTDPKLLNEYCRKAYFVFNPTYKKLIVKKVARVHNGIAFEAVEYGSKSCNNFNWNSVEQLFCQL